MTKTRMQCKDIDDDHVVNLASLWKHGPDGIPGVVDALVAEGVPEKLALAKVLRLVDRGLLEYGASPYYAWPAYLPTVREADCACTVVRAQPSTDTSPVGTVTPDGLVVLRTAAPALTCVDCAGCAYCAALYLVES